jgi:transcriptional regulator with XRE-family HTH domain
MALSSKISARIKEVREKLGLSQTEAAKKIGVHVQTLSKYERGEQSPSSDTIVAFMENLDINPEWLLTGEGRMFGALPDKELYGLDVGLMREIIERVEILFKKEHLKLSPKKKARLIVLLYEELLEDESKKAVLDSKIISITRGLAA